MSLLKKIAKHIMKKIPKSSAFNFMSIENVTSSVVNQARGDIIINQGLVEQLHQSFSNFDFVKASGQMECIKRMTNVSDDFEISFDSSNANVFKMKPKKSEKNPKGVIHIKAILALPREYEKFLSFEDLIRHLFFKQKVLKAKAASLKAVVGNKMISQYERKIEEDVYFLEAAFITQVGMDISVQEKFDGIFTEELIITPPHFNPPISCVMEAGNGMQGINLLLGIEEIDEIDDGIVYYLSNNMQDIPLKISFEINMPKHSMESDIPVDLNYNFLVGEDASKYHKMLVARVFLAMKETQQFILRNPSTGQIICQGKGIGFKEQDYEYFRFWGLINDIEDAFGIDLVLPREISKQDWQTLNDLSEILKYGKKTIGFNDFTATINNATSIANVISYSGGDGLTVEAKCEEVIELFKQRIDLGEQLFYTPPLKLIEKENLQKRFSFFREGEELAVKFAPLYENQKALLVYPRFYGTSDGQEIMRRENLPGCWSVSEIL